MAWITVLLILAGAIAGTVMGGWIRKVAWTVVAALAVWMAWKAWKA